MLLNADVQSGVERSLRAANRGGSVGTARSSVGCNDFVYSQSFIVLNQTFTKFFTRRNVTVPT